MDFDDYKRTMLDIEMPSGLNARTYSRIVQKDAGELLEEEPRVEPYAISAKVGRRPRKRYYVGIGACAAAALVGRLSWWGWEPALRRQAPRIPRRPQLPLRMRRRWPLRNRTTLRALP